MLDSVPRNHEVTWAIAFAEACKAVSDAHRLRKAGADGAAAELDRALKWYLALPKLLLRAPPKGGRRGGSMVDHRFQLYQNGDWKGLVLLFKRDLGDPPKQRQRHKTGGQSREQAIKRALHLIRKGAVGKAVALLEGGGMGDVSDPRIQAQLRAKNPQTRLDWDPEYGYGDAPRMTVCLREVFREADPLVGVGPDGVPTTYYSVLARRSYVDPAAAAAMPAANSLAELILNDELPPWFYLLYTATLQHAPIKTEAASPSETPDCRPVLAGCNFRRLAARAARAKYGDVICDECEPVQLAAGTKGVGQLLAFGGQLAAEQFPDHVFVVLDWRNAFNLCRRSRVIDVIRRTPALAIWQRVYNSHTAPMSPIYYRAEGGLVKNDYASVTGGQQGDLLGGDGYCLATLEDNRWLDAELARRGGGAFRAGMDDGLLHGPPEVVWPLVEEYIARIGASCDMVCNNIKSACWSPNSNYGARPASFPIGTREQVVQGAPGEPVSREVVGAGVTIWGCPLGDPGFVHAKLADKTDGIRSLIAKNQTALASHPDELLQVLRQSLAHRWDYWLQTQPPRVTAPYSAAIDKALDTAYATVFGFNPFDPAAPYRSEVGMPIPDFVARRARLPARLNGLGLRAHAQLADAAFVGAINIAIPAITARVSAAGGVRPGLFEHLGPLVGPGSFDEVHDDYRFSGFLAAGSRLSADFALSWCRMAIEPGLDPDGPLAGPAASAGHGKYATLLQRAVTRHREAASLDALTEEARSLPRNDSRRLAFRNCDSLASTWITCCPSEEDAISADLFGLVASTYLGVEVAAYRPHVGKSIGTRAETRRVLDPFGHNLGLYKPGNRWTWRHDTLLNQVWADTVGAGLEAHTEVLSIFARHVPAEALRRAASEKKNVRRGMVPDMVVRGFNPPHPDAGIGFRMYEMKTLNTNVNAASSCYVTGPRAQDLPRGADVRADKVPSEYHRKALNFDAKYCGVPGGGGPMCTALAGMPEVRPLCFGGYGEGSSTVRSLISDLAGQIAGSRQRREDFNCYTEDQAKGVAAWWLTRRWGRRAVLTAAQVKDSAMEAVLGSDQALRGERARRPPPGGAADAFWAHRRSAQDGPSYAGRAFGGFAFRD